MVKIIASNTCWVLCFEILGRKKLMTSGRGDHWGVVELKTEGRLKLKEDWQSRKSGGKKQGYLSEERDEADEHEGSRA